MTNASPSLELLQLVSLTGADDQTPLAALTSLGQEFPFVEWALLYVPHAEGAPRNPTRRWRESFFDAQVPGQAAVHLVGRGAFEELLEGRLPPELLKADRLQLNINARKREFTDEQVLRVYRQALELGPAVILQYHEETVGVITEFLSHLPAADSGRVHVLLDESRGLGRTPDEWAAPAALGTAFCGFAGGLGPDNMAASLSRMDTLGQVYWADMESGIRTNNQFDDNKARLVLEVAREHRR